jgi:hypothetical protein
MKLLILAAALLSAAVVAAETFTKAPLEVPVMGFKAVVDDGRVVSTWKRYKRGDFAAYKMLKSASKDAPVFPEDAAFWSSSTVGDTFNEDGKLTPGTWHYRLCITTIFGDRWLSPVVTVVVKPEDLKREPPTAADFE